MELMFKIPCAFERFLWITLNGSYTPVCSFSWILISGILRCIYLSILGEIGNAFLKGIAQMPTFDLHCGEVSRVCRQGSSKGTLKLRLRSGYSWAVSRSLWPTYSSLWILQQHLADPQHQLLCPAVLFCHITAVTGTKWLLKPLLCLLYQSYIFSFV